MTGALGAERRGANVKDGVAHSVPPAGGRAEHTELLDLHSRSFPKPIERIESLRSLRFRVPLGSEGTGNLEIMSAK